MLTKIQAAEIATRAGVAVGITDGRIRQPLTALAAGARRGTVIAPQGRRERSRKEWLKSRMLTDGVIVVDAGAAAALARGASLLPAGIRRIEGRFPIGALVAIQDEEGRLLGQGLVGHDATTLRAIAGRRMAEVAARLGPAADRPAIRRDDLVLMPGEAARPFPSPGQDETDG